MEASTYLSAAAITISFVSLIWSVHTGRRDRTKVKTDSYVNNDPGPEEPPHLVLVATNTGRRPVVLTHFRIEFERGGWGEGIGDVRLGEGEVYRYTLSLEQQPFHPTAQGWFEDSHGRQYKIKRFKKAFGELHWQADLERRANLEP